MVILTRSTINEVFVVWNILPPDIPSMSTTNSTAAAADVDHLIDDVNDQEGVCF